MGIHSKVDCPLSHLGVGVVFVQKIDYVLLHLVKCDHSKAIMRWRVGTYWTPPAITTTTKRDAEIHIMVFHFFATNLLTESMKNLRKSWLDLN